MPEQVTWRTGVRELVCRVCRWQGAGELIVSVTALAQVGLEGTRCPKCASVQLMAVALDSSPTDASIDGYVECGAGLGAIADAIGSVDPARVQRFLDVGCNFPFAADLGRFLFGWQVTGIEPSLAGSRGGRELDIDVQNEYLTEETQLGGSFDLILASEVIEHVGDPLGFLRAIYSHVVPGGAVVLTTPAAEIVASGEKEAHVLAAISAGYHVFLASRHGLAGLLAQAGFDAVQVQRQEGTLRASARRPFAGIAPGEGETASPRPSSISAQDLERYFRYRAGAAPDASALTLGMTVRLFRSLVARGEMEAATEAFPQLRRTFLERYQLDLAEPGQTSERIATDGSAPWSLAGAAFALGMLNLLHSGDSPRALACFELAEQAATLWRVQAGVADLDTVDLLDQSAYHRLLALAQVDPVRAAGDAVRALGQEAGITDSDLDETQAATRLCRIFVEIVAQGAYFIDHQITRFAEHRGPTLATSEVPEARQAGLDTLFSLGILRLNTADAAAAEHWFSRTVAACDDDERADAPAGALRTAAEAHLQIARARLAADAEAVVEPNGGADPAAGASAHSMIDTYWCDAAGVFLQGWVHLNAQKIRRITVSVAGAQAVAARNERPDLLTFWPGENEVVQGGFSAWVPGGHGRQVVLVLETDQGIVEHPLTLPAHSLPVQPTGDDPEVALLQLQELIKNAPPGPVLALGIRSATPEVFASRIEVFGDREVVGFDIHAGVGVDIVGDAHRLSDLLSDRKFAVVFSGSLLEHVTAPWLVAAECSRVLHTGGLAVHVAPWLWPTHAEPNDFWRFSPEGLGQLFGPALGFDILDSGASGEAVVVPGPAWRAGATHMPTTTSRVTSWIVARKTGDVNAAFNWPYDAAVGERTAQQYPVSGLSAE